MKTYFKKITSIVLICAFIFSCPAGLFAEVIDLREEGDLNGWSFAYAILSGFYSGWSMNPNWGTGQMFVRTYLIPKLSDKLVWKLGVHDQKKHTIFSSMLSAFLNGGVNYGEAGAANWSWGGALTSAGSAGVESLVSQTVYEKYEDKDKGFAQFASYAAGLAVSQATSYVTNYDANKNQQTTDQAANETEASGSHGTSAAGSESSFPEDKNIKYKISKDEKGRIVLEPVEYLGEDGEYVSEKHGILYKIVETKEGLDLVPIGQLGRDGNYHAINPNRSLMRFLRSVLTGRDWIPGTVHIQVNKEAAAPRGFLRWFNKLFVRPEKKHQIQYHQGPQQQPDEDQSDTPIPPGFYIPDNRFIVPDKPQYQPMLEVKQPNVNSSQVASVPVDYWRESIDTAWNSVSN